MRSFRRVTLGSRFSSGNSVILMCGTTAVSSSLAVCGFSSFWLTVIGKRRSFTVLWYRSCLVQVNTICNTKHSMHGKLVVNLQCVIVVAPNDPAFRSFLPFSRVLLTFSRWGCARCWRGHYARWMQLYVRVTDHKCSISISSIFDSGFWYLPTFLTILRYWAPPNVPLLLGGGKRVPYMGLSKLR